MKQTLALLGILLLCTSGVSAHEVIGYFKPTGYHVAQMSYFYQIEQLPGGDIYLMGGFRDKNDDIYDSRQEFRVYKCTGSSIEFICSNNSIPQYSTVAVGGERILISGAGRRAQIFDINKKSIREIGNTVVFRHFPQLLKGSDGKIYIAGGRGMQDRYIFGLEQDCIRLPEIWTELGVLRDEDKAVLEQYLLDTGILHKYVYSDESITATYNQLVHDWPWNDENFVIKLPEQYSRYAFRLTGLLRRAHQSYPRYMSVFDPETETFSLAGRYQKTRQDGGRIVSIGGKIYVTDEAGDVEEYDYRTKIFTPVKGIEMKPGYNLDEWRVVWKERDDRHHIKVYDYRTGETEVITTDLLLPLYGARIIALDSEHLLICGGYSGPEDPQTLKEKYRITDDAFIVDLAEKKVSRTLKMSYPRAGHSVFKLRDGEVLVIGGAKGRGWDNMVSETEVYRYCLSE